MGEYPVRATHARIHLNALRNNFRTIRNHVLPGTAICAAVKADAYGHGVEQVSRVLREEGAEVLGVSSPYEGAELRDLGDRGRILVFGPTVPGEIELTLDAGLETMVTDTDYLDALESSLKRRPDAFRIPVHLKVNTGMNRVGCRPEEAPRLAERIAANPKLVLAGLATHFPVADSPETDHLEFTANQIRILKDTAESLRTAGLPEVPLHASNSGAIALSPESWFQMVRPGISLYGYGVPLGGPGRLKPVMEMVTRITAVKTVNAGETVSYGRTWTAGEDTRVATLPVGYADGYRRLLSNKADVLINGKRYPVIGTVCMDQIMIDLGKSSDVGLHHTVVLFGPDRNGPDAEDLARIAGTISYEITCGISKRVPRVYLDD